MRRGDIHEREQARSVIPRLGPSPEAETAWSRPTSPYRCEASGRNVRASWCSGQVIQTVHQIAYLHSVRDIGRGGGHCTCQSTFGIDAGVCLHAKEPLLAFACPVHFQLARVLVIVLNPRGRVNIRSDDDAALPKQQTLVRDISIDCHPQSWGERTDFQLIAEIQESAIDPHPVVGQGQPGKTMQWRHPIQRLFHRLVAVAEQVRHPVNAQHIFHRVWQLAVAVFGVASISAEGILPSTPRSISCKALGSLLLTFVPVLNIRKDRLRRATAPWVRMSNCNWACGA